MLSLISPGLVSPLSLEVIIIRFFFLRFIPLLFLLVPLVGTLIIRIGLGFPWTPKFLHLSFFASVDAGLGFFNDLILYVANNFIPRISSSGKIHLPWWTPECSVSRAKKAHLSPLAPVEVPSGLD